MADGCKPARSPRDEDWAWHRLALDLRSVAPDCAHLRRRPGARTIREHAERLGVGRCVVERALQMLGGYQTRSGRRANLLDSEVDPIVRAYLARPDVIRCRAGRARRAA